MPLRGAAIGPDAVLVWTGARELTRFDRRGARASFAIRLSRVAAQIDASSIRIVDNLGTLHRYSLTGEHAGAIALRSPPRSFTAAALAGSRDRIALLEEEEVVVYERGEPLTWNVSRPLDGYREIGCDLSADGDRLLIAYETFSYFTGYGSGGESGSGFHVTDAAGERTIETRSWSSIRDAHTVLSPDGNHVIGDEAWANGRYVYAMSTDGTDWALTHSSPLQLAFRGPHVAVLLDRELAVVELATRRRATLEIPERFMDVVMTDDNIVLIHAELGAWWIPTSTLMFEADA